ncbi:hypothetical protein Htur_4485 (plasmid) [Haloterrigena turkmenica DSM 5511]|uniref:DUF624 domain-containing protein n=2 Tax=Haloterrigena turkmenica TaxID=62320 RepID=D2S1P9_HALTV|nr:hypothetical protein Htur_4485 [Haloterrigena turkmenica DSM 5511]
MRVTGATMNTSDDIRSVHHGLGVAFKSAYNHSGTMVLVSLLWVIASLPLITIGPATLAAYKAVLTLREEGEIDREAVVSTLSQHWHNSVLLSGVFVAFAAVTVGYATNYVLTGAVQSGTLAVVACYLTAHLSAVLVVAFVRLAEGNAVYDAVTGGYSWTATHPFDTVLLGFVSIGLFVLCAVLTVTVCLAFPFLLFTFHVAVVAEREG